MTNSANESADVIMRRLMLEAKGQPKRIGNLQRLKAACDAILDGSAHRVATEQKLNKAPFAKCILTPTKIGQYIRMMDDIALKEGKLPWPGPHRVTIYADRDLLAYVEERKRGAPSVREPSATKDLKFALEAIVEKLPPTDQSILRIELERGRLALVELNMLKALVAKLGPFSADELAGDLSTLSVNSSGLSGNQKEVMNSLLGRITNKRFLDQFGLVFLNDRIRLDYGSEKDLMFPEELRLLRVLAGRVVETEESDYAATCPSQAS